MNLFEYQIVARLVIADLEAQEVVNRCDCNRVIGLDVYPPA